jgi:ABC-type lipoprotein export system ATPase subunit
MPTAPTFIQAESVSREYRLGETVIRAIDAVSLTIEKGEFLALLGSSGSGKSTLLSMMAGLDRPTSGAIRVRDRNLAELEADELARYRRETVGMVFQSFNLLPRMTLEENVELPLRLAEVDRHDRQSRVSEALDRVGLGPRNGTGPASCLAASNSAALWLAR